MSAPAIAIVDGQLRISPAVGTVAMHALDWITRKCTREGDALLGVGLSIVLLTLEQMPRERVRETVNAMVTTLQRFTNDLMTPTLIVPAGGGE